MHSTAQAGFRRALWCAAVSGALLLLPLAASAQEPEPYAATLTYGSGLIRTPVAWVSPRMGDLLLSGSGTSFAAEDGSWNMAGALETHWARRVSLGVSLYSNGPEWGFFGSALLLEEGRVPHLPGVAVGVRNLGPFRHMDRLQVSYDEIGSSPDEPLPFARDFRTAPTIYGVATRSLAIGRVQASLSVGYGNGLFSDDGDLGEAYNRSGTIASGLFLGARAVLWSSDESSITVLAENDGWDWNAGVVGSWRGFTLGLYGTELEEGSRDGSVAGPLAQYNYTKLNVSLGYRANIFDIAGGTRMRSRVTELEQEQQRLRGEITQREERIKRLEAQLRTTQAGELGEVQRRRQQLEDRIDEEREAIRRAEERLRQLEVDRQPRGQQPR